MVARTRRRFLVSGALALATVLAGCTDSSLAGESTTTPSECEAGTRTGSDRCESVELPKPDEPVAGGAEPTTYPDFPATLSAETARSYAVAFERAFRRNDFVANAGHRETRSLSLRAGAVDTVSLDCGFAVAVNGSIRSDVPRLTVPEEATETPTPIPIYDNEFAVWYLVAPDRAKRLAMGGNFGDPTRVPSFADAETVHCG